MDERDQASSAGGHELASEVGERVRTIISAAEAAANALRHEAEQTAAVRRRIAEEEAARIIEDAKADADAYLAERIRRIAELSDTVVERAETIVSRLDRAEEVRRQLQSLADALGESAERLATEVRVGTPPPTVRSPSTPPAATPPAVDVPASTEAPPEAGVEPPPAYPGTAAEAIAEPEPEAAEPQDAVTPGSPEAVDTAAPEAPPAGVEPAPPPPSSAERAPEAPVVDAPPVVEPEPSTVVEPEPPAAVEPEPPAAEAPDAEANEVVRLDRREPPAAEAPAEPDRREADDQLGARLVALQMAVAGGARGEVEVHLRRTFDLEDCTSILDDVFGQGTDADKRVAWPRPADGAA